ncbi:hypothetical protein Q3G72_033284 [Acer saccharum]|nr:hypothetical protein Q3G72_033284 [Acer saccharum]
MLLNHPFVATIDNQLDQDHEETITLKDCKESSPRSRFSFPDWVSIQSSSENSSSIARSRSSIMPSSKAVIASITLAIKFGGGGDRELSETCIECRRL